MPTLTAPRTSNLAAMDAAALVNAELAANQQLSASLPPPSSDVRPPASGLAPERHVAASPQPERKPVEIPAKLYFTGRLKAGKDFVAAAAGAKIFGFADPMYWVSEHLFGTSNKDLPGVRDFLQTLGQWGRNTLDAENPYSPTRGMFIQFIRAMSGKIPKEYCVQWDQFGKSENLWVDALIKRISQQPAEKRVAVSNCRFADEAKALTDAGFQGWHVMCSSKTWGERLVAAKKNLQSPELNNISERMAATMDAQVMSTVSREPSGKRLRVVWNDPKVPRPSSRLFTLDEFLAGVK